MTEYTTDTIIDYINISTLADTTNFNDLAGKVRVILKIFITISMATRAKANLHTMRSWGLAY